MDVSLRTGRASIARALTGLAAALLAGCATVPHETPQLAAAEANALGLAGPSAPMAADWWTALGDPQLDRIMAQALADNPNLAVAAARLRAAQTAIEAQGAALRPQLSADVEETRERLSEKYIIPPPYAGTDRWVGTAQANLSLSLDLAGRQRAVVEQARATAGAAALEIAAARVTLAGAIGEAYVNLARAEAKARIAHEFTASREQGLHLAQVRRRNQLASDFDIRAAETLLAEARQAEVRAVGARAIAVHALAALAGRGADFYPTVTTAALAPATALPVPAALPADLLGRRADILAARARIEAAQAGRRVARADFYPNIDLRAFLGVSAIGLGNLFTTAASTYGVGPAIHLPIFDAGRLEANYRGALAEIDVAVAQYNELVTRAVRDAADALSGIETNAADAARQREIVAGLSETVRLDQVRVRTGLSAQLDVLEAGDRVLAARQAQADLDADGAIRRIQLITALGGGFLPADAPQQTASAEAAGTTRR